MTQKETEREIRSIRSFIRTGLFVLSIVLVASLAVAYGQNHLPGEDSVTTGTTTTSGKKLPIYCVEQKEKKIALSFDAAWGNGRLMEDRNILLSLHISLLAAQSASGKARKLPYANICTKKQSNRNNLTAPYTLLWLSLPYENAGFY